MFAGFSATESAGARPIYSGKITTSLPAAPNTIQVCYSGPNCKPRTKNAALPTTTSPKTGTKAKPAQSSTKKPSTTVAKGKSKTKTSPTTTGG